MNFNELHSWPRLGIGVAIVTFAGLTCACGGVSGPADTPDTQPGDSVADAAGDQDGDAPDAMASDAQTETGTCTTLTNSGPVTGVSVAGSGPVLSGGAITPGDYVLVSFVDYAGSTGQVGVTSTLRRAQRFSSTRYEVVRRDNSDPESSGAGTYQVPSSAQLFVQPDCPTTSGAGSANYFSDGSTLKLHIGGPPGTHFDRVVVMQRLGP